MGRDATPAEIHSGWRHRAGLRASLRLAAGPVREWTRRGSRVDDGERATPSSPAVGRVLDTERERADDRARTPAPDARTGRPAGGVLPAAARDCGGDDPYIDQSRP